MWMKNKWFQSLGGGFWEEFGLRTWSKLQLIALQGRKDETSVKLLKTLQQDRRTLMSAFESYLVYSLARDQKKLPGAYAEVGVYRGGSAKTICECKGDRPLFLFDTFAGLPPTSAGDAGIHRENQYACSLESVQTYLKDYPNVHYFPGLFPDSAKEAPEQTYCFAHFDVDLYEGTKGCLEYFYPRMVPGGVMLSHDYGILVGVEKAFQEFFADKPEVLIELPTTQCMVVKR